MTVKVDGTKGLLQNYDYLVATTGFSYTFTTANGLVLNPAGTIATGTVTMPASAVDGMTVTISSTKQITALTVNGSSGQTISNPVTTLLAGSAITYLYRADNATWFPFADASATPIELAKSISIGWSQTWQNVTSSRSSGTTYTNSTGKPIMVNAFSNQIDSGFSLTAVVDGVTVGFGGGGGGGDARRTGFVAFIVPNGSTYSVNYTNGATGSTLQWAELR